MATQRITERISPQALRGVRAEDIDEDAGVIRNVYVCGPVSRNNRSYPDAVWERDHKAYHLVKVNFDHLERPAAGRKFEDLGGWLSDPTPGRRATLHVLKSDPRSAKVFELARRNPNAFGLSHVAHCRTRRENGVEVVEAIESVESVDIVVDPATVRGLFESEGGRTVSTVREVLESWRPKYPAEQQRVLGQLLFVEDVGAMLDAPMDAPAEDSTHDAVTKSAISSIIADLGRAVTEGEVTEEEAVKRFRLAIKHHGKIKGTASTEETPKESKEPTVKDLMAVREACKAKGWENPAIEQLVRIAKQADPADREALIAESLLAAEARRLREQGERPKSAPRQPVQQPDLKAESTVPTDGKKFAESVRK